MSKGSSASGTWREAIFTFIGAVGIALTCVLIVYLTSTNFDIGKSHTCTSDTVTATLQSNGDLHVVESRSYHFTGSWELTAEKLDPPKNGIVKVNGVSVIDASGNKRALRSQFFNTDWRDSGGPIGECYAVDSEENTVYAFSHSTNEDKTFIFDYTYTNAVTRYDDCSVLYWQFIPSGWDVDTNNVTATISLPATAESPMKAGTNVFAYGHAAESGSIATDDASNSVTYTMPVVPKGTFAEARIAFPLAWTSSAPSTTQASGAQLDAIKAEEGKWQQAGIGERALSALYLIIPLLIGGGMALTALILYRRYGTEYEPTFKEKYWRDVPDPSLHPLLIARLWHADDKDDNDLTISLMYLSSQGYVRIEPVMDGDQGTAGLHGKVEDYRLVPTGKPLVDAAPTDQLTYSLVFDEIGGGAPEGVKLGDIKHYADAHPDEYLAQIAGWQHEVDVMESAHPLFEREGVDHRNIVRVLAGLTYLVVGVLFFDRLLDGYQFLCIAIGAACMYALAKVMPRRSRESVDVYARCEGLEHWFEDFTRLDEAVPTDTKVWGQLFIYAYLFGVANKVAQDLTAVYPDLWTDESFVGQSFWYYNAAETTAGAVSMGAGDLFGSVFGSASSTAHDVLGGGMSGGGGGGFGGGGGGFSR